MLLCSRHDLFGMRTSDLGRQASDFGPRLPVSQPSAVSSQPRHTAAKRRQNVAQGVALGKHGKIDQSPEGAQEPPADTPLIWKWIEG